VIVAQIVSKAARDFFPLQAGLHRAKILHFRRTVWIEHPVDARRL